MYEGDVEDREMFRTFNMGIGMVAVVAPADQERVLTALEAAGEKASVIGEVVAGEKEVDLNG